MSWLTLIRVEARASVRAVARVATRHPRASRLIAAWMSAICWVLATTNGAAAQLEDGDPLAVVISGDVEELALRSLLAERLQRPVTTLSRAQAQPGGPVAVLTIAVDPHAGVSLMYWQPGDQPQLIVAPTVDGVGPSLQRIVELAQPMLRRPNRQARLALEANPYLRKMPAGGRRRPTISPVNPYHRHRF